MIDYAKFEESCLEVIDNVIAFKKSHNYYYQVQMQLAVTGYSWYDYFLCTIKDSFQQKIYSDKAFWLINKRKLEIFYSKIVVTELLRGNFNTIKFDTEVHMILLLKSFSDT